MNGKLLFRIVTALLLVTFTLAAAPVNLSRTVYSKLGDVVTTAAPYYNVDNRLFNTTQSVLVGGALDSALSGAVIVSDNVVTSWTYGATNTPATYATNNLPSVVAGGPIGVTSAQLAGGLIDAVNTGIYDASIIYWTGVTADATSTLDMRYDFIDNDGDPYQDFAFFSIWDAATPTTAAQISFLGDTLYNDYFHTGPTALPLHPFTSASSSFVVALGVVNVAPWSALTPAYSPQTVFNMATLDPLYDGNPGISDPALLLDPVPEPGTWMLAGAGLLLAGLARRKK